MFHPNLFIGKVIFSFGPYTTKQLGIIPILRVIQDKNAW